MLRPRAGHAVLETVGRLVDSGRTGRSLDDALAADGHWYDAVSGWLRRANLPSPASWRDRSMPARVAAPQ